MLTHFRLWYVAQGHFHLQTAEGLGPNDSGIIGATTLPPVLQLSDSHIAVMSPLFAKCKWGILFFSEDICLQAKFIEAKKLQLVLRGLGSH